VAGQLTVHGNWEYDGSARTAAPSKVCVDDILASCLWTIIGQQTKDSIRLTYQLWYTPGSLMLKFGLY